MLPMTPNQAIKEFKTVKALATALEVSRQTIYTWRDAGEFPSWAQALVDQKVAGLKAKETSV